MFLGKTRGKVIALGSGIRIGLGTANPDTEPVGLFLARRSRVVEVIITIFPVVSQL